MRLKFLHIYAEGFMSLSKVDLDLADRGLVLVSGVNTNPKDNSKSNGSGKSSIFEAIFYAATGYTIRGAKDIVNRNYPLGCKVELTISRGEDVFKIIRSRSHHELGTRVSLFMNDEDISGKTMRDCDQVIKQYLPELALDVIASVVILGQGLPYKLTSRSPKDRKQLLEDLSQTSHLIEEVRAKLDTRKFNQDEELKDITSRLTSISVETTTLQKVIDDIRSKMSYTLDEVNSDILKYIDEMNTLSEEIEVVKKEEEEFISLLLNKNKQKGEISSTYHNLLFQQRELQSKLDKLANNICPTCGRPLDNIDHLNKERDQIMVSMSELASKAALTKKEMDKIDQAILELTGSKSQISATRNSLDAKLITINSKLDNLGSTKAVIESAEADIAKHSSRIDELSNEASSLVPRQNEITSSLNSLGYLDRALSKEFKSYLLESVIEYLNKQISRYSSILFTSGYIKLISNGNNLDIEVGEKSYESLSGGERQKADLCVQLALRDMLVNVTGFSCNMLVLDEIFDNLDEKGCDNLLKLLTQLFSDIDSVYVITHHAEISIPKDTEIIVTKDVTDMSHVEVRVE